MQVSRKILPVTQKRVPPNQAQVGTKLSADASSDFSVAPKEVRESRSSLSATAIRTVKFAHLCQKIHQVPGEEPTFLNDLFRKFEVTASGNYPATYGVTNTEEMLCRALSPGVDAEVELKTDNFMVLAREPLHLDAQETVVGCGVVTGRSDDAPLGYFVLTSWLDAGAERHDHLDYLMLDVSDSRTKGLGDVLCNQMHDLAEHRGVKSKGLLTAWIGRKFWANRGFDFRDEDERQRVFEYLRGFLRYFQIRPDDLVLCRGDCSEPLVFPHGADSVDALENKLEHSWDFVALKSLRGPIRLPLLLGDNNVVEREVDVGSAFMLGNWKILSCNQSSLETGWESLLSVLKVQASIS